jgi:hypothetical protein
VTLSISNWSEVTNFWVVDSLAEGVILGWNWLHRQEAVVDARQECLRFGPNERHTIHWVHTTPVAGQVDMGWTTSLATDLSATAFKAYCTMLKSYADVFRDAPVLTQTRTIKHDIIVNTEAPIRTRPYPCSDAKRRLIDAQIREMLRQHIIEPTTSLHQSPVVLQPKKDGTLRFCVDYRKLNTHTLDDAFPMGNLQEMIRALGSASIYTKLDLKSGYWQVPLTERAKPLTAFSTSTGATYQFRVMSFGLKNAPATFQRLMSQEVLVGYLHDFALVYLDDVIIYSRTEEDHLIHVAKVLERLQLHGLIVNLDKCIFARTKIIFLGMLIGKDGNLPEPEHLDAIRNAERPTNKKKLQAFLGLCGWVREHVPRAAEILAPLTALLSNERWKWPPQAEAAFHQVKKAFSNIQALARPDPDLPFVLQTDASKHGAAAVLYQEPQEGQRRIISYASIKFNETQQRWHSNEQECYAALWAAKRYRMYLEGRPFVLRTDNKALQWLQSTKEEKSKYMRWALQLQGFNYRVEHVPGRENHLADALSRAPQRESTEDQSTDNPDRLVPPSSTVSALTEPSPPIFGVVYLAQEEDEEIQHIVQQLQTLTLKEASLRTKAENHLLKEWTLCDNRYLYHGDKVLVPTSAVLDVCQYYHDDELAGHPGAAETITAIARFFFWPTLAADVKDYVANCLLCQQTKSGTARPKALLHLRQPTVPFQTLSVDLMGPYPRTQGGSTHLLTVEDLFTRWLEAYPMRRTTTHDVARQLEEHFFHRYGYPESIISDNGPQFRKAWDNFCQRRGIQPIKTAVYHPRGNPVERQNQNVKTGLRLRMSQLQRHTNWDQHVKPVLFCLRRRVNRALGHSPAQMLFGVTIRRPGEWDSQTLSPPSVAQLREDAKIRQSRYVETIKDSGIESGNLYQIGQSVLVKNHPLSNKSERKNAGFCPRWLGPFTIQEEIAPDVYTVTNEEGTEKTVHADQIKNAQI